MKVEIEKVAIQAIAELVVIRVEVTTEQVIAQFRQG